MTFFLFFGLLNSLLKHTYEQYFKYPQIKIGTFMVIDPMVNRAHHGGACSSSSLVEMILKAGLFLLRTSTCLLAC